MFVRSLRYVPLCSFAILVLVAPTVAVAGKPVNCDMDAVADLERLQHAFAALAEEMRPSVVAIQTQRRIVLVEQGTEDTEDPDIHELRMPSIGSGIVIRANGKVLTNEHVVHGADEVSVVLYDGSRHVATAVDADPRSDLAVVTIDAEGLKPAELGDLSHVRQGHWAFAMGNPFGMGADGTPIFTEGIISAIGRKLFLDPTDMRYYGNLIQTTAAINPGNSGGPLVNIYGEVIGINTAISTRTGANEGVGFAVPIEARTRRIIDTLLAGERVEYGFLGVLITRADMDGSNGPARGASIQRVEPGSPAAKGNLEAGDIIIAFDGEDVSDADQLVRLVGATPVGKRVDVRYLRGGKEKATVVTLARRALPTTDAAQIAWRGMAVAEPSLALREQFALPDDAKGMVIVRVEADSAAGRAGLEPGQVIMKIGKHLTRSLDECADAIRDLEGPATLTLSDKSTVSLDAE